MAGFIPIGGGGSVDRDSDAHGAAAIGGPTVAVRTLRPPPDDPITSDQWISQA